MDELKTEKEQLEELRAWWGEYYLVVIAGVVIAIGGIVGLNYYNKNKLSTQVAASALFESLAEHVSGGDLDAAEAVASDLASDYGSTPYAAQSRLAMARLYMDKNRDQDAADMLSELLAMRGNEALKDVARLRLARIFLYQDKAADVVDLLASAEAPAFAGLYAEALGDAYAALGDVTNAAAEYNRALLDPSPNAALDRDLIQMKLADLPAAVATAAEDGVSE